MKSHKYIYQILVLLGIIGLVVFKWDKLFLPFFWDEAWVYGPAVMTMAESGPCLSPGCISQHLHTGHPLLFYFSAAMWMVIFGISTLSGHAFAMTISVAFLISVYIIVGKLSNQRAGFIAFLILLAQPVFISLSSFMLAEIFLSLIAIWTMYFYVKRKWALFIFFACLLVSTKESGFIFLAAIYVHFILQNWRLLLTKKGIVSGLIVLIPFLVGCSFFVVQKIDFGWYFFPRHLNWVDINFHAFVKKGSTVVNFLFIDQGRLNFFYVALPILVYLSTKNFFDKPNIKFILSGISLISLALFPIASILIFLGLTIVFSLKNLNTETKGIFIIAGIFCAIYILFSSINFLSLRYLFIIFPMIAIVVAIKIGTISGSKYLAVIFMLFVVVNGFFSIKKNMNANNVWGISLTYSKMVEVHQDVVDYILDNDLRDEKILTHGLVFTAFTNPMAGYVDKDMEPLNHINNFPPDSSEIVIYSCIEQDAKFKPILENDSLLVLKEFRDGPAWSIIYRRIAD